MKNSYTQKEQYYGEYLGLDKILDAQLLESEARGIDAHDEMLFIIIHQTYELWFKQIMYELNSIIDIFQATSINDNAPSLQIAVHRTNRIIEIWKLLVSQVDVLETMTPMDFLDFRDLLTPASGFQSVQFRELETKLGLKMENRHEQHYYEHQLCPMHVAQIKELDTKESFLDLLEQWLERTPIWAAEDWNDFEVPKGAKKDIHPFWATYRHTFESGLVSEELAAIKMSDFDRLILGEGEQETRLSAASLQAALFITLYRDYPLMQMPYQLLSKWLEIDELMANWRYRHMSMVRRMIGMRVGTGGSTGASYLKGAMEKHHIFGDFTRITTYLIPRAKLPTLPLALEQKLRFTTI